MFSNLSSRKQLQIHFSSSCSFFKMSNQIVENPNGDEVSQIDGQMQSGQDISAVDSSDIYVEFSQLIQTILSTYHILEIWERIMNYIRNQPYLKVIIGTVLALFFSPLLLFICLMGIGALSILIPLSLFYQSFVFMVIISAKFLGKLVLALANEP